jgi:hypothetical protein
MDRFVVLSLVIGLLFINACGRNDESAGKGQGARTEASQPKVSTEVVTDTSAGDTEHRSEPELVAGETGSSLQWGSGWLDLATVTDFAAGDLLRLHIGGTADRILVRLLPEGKFPDSSDGIIGGAVTVPENRIVEVVLDKDRKGIIQISVHGGPNPWGKFPLGGGNGPATLLAAELVR